jgi:tellurite resistance protein
MSKSTATSKRPTKEKLADYAEAVRKELTFRAQDDVFRVAVEVGYLAARADGEVDASEKQAIVDAAEILSKGVIIELEVESIIEEVEALGDDDDARAAKLGEQLKDHGQAEPGLLLGAFVAQATAGIDASERKILRAVGRAAGINDRRVRAILKAIGDDSD